MNILKWELRNGLKVFFFWLLGLIFIDFAGLTKYTGIAGSSASVDVMELMGQFPKIFLAVFGMADLDISSPGGYFAILHFYVLICISIYSVHIGAQAVNREMADKTYEFLFTKPRSRRYVIAVKLGSGVIYLAAYCVFHFVFSKISIWTLNIEANIDTQIFLFCVTAFLSGLLYLSAGAFFGVFINKSEKGILAGNLFFLMTFICGVIYDLLENGLILRILSPLKYFLPGDILSKRIMPQFVLLCILITAILFFKTFTRFKQKDLVN